MNLPCSLCVIRTVAVPDASPVTPATRVLCSACCAHVTRRQQIIAAKRAPHRYFPAFLPVACASRVRTRVGGQRAGEQREAAWKGESLCSPRIQAAALADLVKLGRSTVEEVRELVAVPDDLAERLRKFDEHSGERGMDSVLRWRRKVLAELERLFENQSLVPL